MIRWLQSWFYHNPGLPVAKFDADSKLSNPDILQWTTRSDGLEEGRGAVWVEWDKPLLWLHPEYFCAVSHWGKLQIAVVRKDGVLGPMVLEP